MSNIPTPGIKLLTSLKLFHTVSYAILVLSKDLFQKQKPFIYLFSAVEDSNDVVCL